LIDAPASVQHFAADRLRGGVELPARDRIHPSELNGDAQALKSPRFARVV